MPTRTKDLTNINRYNNLASTYLADKGMVGSFPLDYATRVQNYLGRDSVVAYWKLDDGLPSQDYLGLINNSYMYAPKSASINNIFSSGSTFEIWIKNTSGVAYIFHKQWENAYAVYLNGGKFNCIVRYDTTNATLLTSDLPAITDNQWHHFVFYFNDAGDKKIYVALDGVWSTSTQVAGVGNIVDDSAYDFYISRAGTVSINGGIGWSRIYSGDKYGIGVNFSPPDRLTVPDSDVNTLALWSMNEGYGNISGDLSSNNNDISLLNCLWGSYPVTKDVSGNSNNGVYTGVRLGDVPMFGNVGGYAPLFDGVNDYSNIYSSQFNSDFNGVEGSAVVWCKVRDSSVWTDTIYRHCFNLYADANNRIHIRKSGGALNNQMEVWWKAGTASKTLYQSDITSTDWLNFALTWSVSNDRVIFYKNGGSPQESNTLDTWVGSLSSTNTLIGAYDTSQLRWNGWLAHIMFLNREISPTEVLQLYNWGV